MVDLTPLGEKLDAELLRRVQRRWHESMRTALERHGGTVERFIGDAVMAVFGLPVAHEDDAPSLHVCSPVPRGRLCPDLAPTGTAHPGQMTTSPHFAPTSPRDPESTSPSSPSPYTRGANWAGRGRKALPMTARDQLAQVLHPDLLDRIDAYIEERVSSAVDVFQQTNGNARWVTLEDAAELPGCSPDAPPVPSWPLTLIVPPSKSRSHQRRASASGPSPFGSLTRTAAGPRTPEPSRRPGTWAGREGDLSGNSIVADDPQAAVDEAGRCLRRRRSRCNLVDLVSP
jgi:hypothetical protein